MWPVRADCPHFSSVCLRLLFCTVHSFVTIEDISSCLQSRTLKKTIFSVLVKLFALQPILLLLWSVELTILTDASIESICDERLISFTNFNAQFLYSLTICMLHYNPRHFGASTCPSSGGQIVLITVSCIVTLCTVQHSMLYTVLYRVYCTVLYRE